MNIKEEGPRVESPAPSGPAVVSNQSAKADPYLQSPSAKASSVTNQADLRVTCVEAEDLVKPGIQLGQELDLL